ncbi:MAG: sodium-translocating pyrophosphatase [Candidatus Eremiobacteraeota bacterium]|nr:sodium-translocating pyrophosphatase [Candidatus Eremiobacteraeota bacterium]
MSAWTIYTPWIGIAGILFAVLTYFSVRKYSPGNKKMQDIADKIHLGAMVFLRKEYSIIAIFMVIVFLALGLLIKGPNNEAIGWWTGLAYLFGALCSMGAGWLGMEAATKANVRTCQAAKDGGTPAALSVAFLGGSVMGILVASLGVVGLGVLFYFTRGNPTTAPMIISGFAMGASSIALFARVGGGIYTKSADVGADLVGKIEAGIPEDDPRNPGVIADNVGDNVGDTAGMGADLFESYVGSVVAAIAIGAIMANTVQGQLKWISFPILLITIGLICSFIGINSMHILKKMDPQSALRNSTYIAGILFLIGAGILTWYMIGSLHMFWAILAGMICGVLIGIFSEYFTSGPPVKEVAKQCESGPATTIIGGMAVGFKSCILPLLALCVAIYVAYSLGSVQPNVDPGLGGLYAIALAGVGMLATVGVVMTTDSYGPIADNAGGIAEMSGAGPEIRKITDKLDSLGNTTAAIGKGFAIGSAAITALALFSAYQKAAHVDRIDLTNVNTIVGLLLGGLMPFIIAALTMEAVGKAANLLVKEIRRQFKEIKGLMEGKAEPDVDKCISIATDGSLREMIIPGVLAVISPLLIGFVLGKEALGGFLAGAVVTGVLLGIFMSNTGAIWDNAKKWIEEGNLGGKGSLAHKAAVVGDTVGDPFKDTSGPSMNILIKLMTVVSLVFAPVFAGMTMSLIDWIFLK